VVVTALLCDYGWLPGCIWGSYGVVGCQSIGMVLVARVWYSVARGL